MSVSSKRSVRPLTWFWGCLLLATVWAASGCQMDIGGQTLPSPYYMLDDPQYYAPGPEFKLAREAAALKSLGEDQGLEAP